MAENLYVLVLPGPKTPRGSVGLYEMHPDHPKTTEFPEGGQAFVANTKPRIVARTPAVNTRLADGRLKEVEAKDVYRGDDFSRTPHVAIDPVTEKPLEIGELPPPDPRAGVGTGERPNQGDPGTTSNVDGTVVIPNDPDIRG